MSEWRPIETAPKDGTWVLLGGGKTSESDYKKEGVRVQRPVVAFWQKPDEEWDDGDWMFCYWDGAWRTGYDDATHWMPLPELPR